MRSILNMGFILRFKVSVQWCMGLFGFLTAYKQDSQHTVSSMVADELLYHCNSLLLDSTRVH